MTTPRYEITDEQQEVLDIYPDMKPVSFLDDGDLLVLESFYLYYPPPERRRLVNYEPGVVSTHGNVHGVCAHYELSHDLSKPFTGRPAGEEVTGGPQ